MGKRTIVCLCGSTRFWRMFQRADRALILNVGDYIGASTARELAHARELGTAVRWLEWPSPHAIAGEAPWDLSLDDGGEA